MGLRRRNRVLGIHWVCESTRAVGDRHGLELELEALDGKKMIRRAFICSK